MSELSLVYHDFITCLIKTHHRRITVERLKITAFSVHYTIDELNLRDEFKDNLKRFFVKSKHDHFTLDHVLNKADHTIAALSLHNFVPSCYACNCKFKGKVELIETPIY